MDLIPDLRPLPLAQNVFALYRRFLDVEDVRRDCELIQPHPLLRPDELFQRSGDLEAVWSDGVRASVQYHYLLSDSLHHLSLQMHLPAPQVQMLDPCSPVQSIRYVWNCDYLRLPFDFRCRAVRDARTKWINCRQR